MKPEFVVTLELERTQIIPPEKKTFFSATSLGLEFHAELTLGDREGNTYSTFPVIITYAVSCLGNEPLGLARLWVAEDVAQEPIDSWEEAQTLLPEGWSVEVEFGRQVQPFLVFSHLTDKITRGVFFRHKDWRRDWKRSLFYRANSGTITIPERVMANIRWAHDNDLALSPYTVY